MKAGSYSPGLKIGIAAHAGPGGTGGIARFIESLVQALGRLDDGDEKYLILVQSEAHRAWLEPLLGPNQEIVLEPRSLKEMEQRKRALMGRSRIGMVKWALGPLLPAARNLQGLLTRERQWPEVPISDGYYESLGCDVLHIANQPFFLCAIPTVYNPHDLQHRHYPQFWTPEILAWRETLFSAGCHLAQGVVVGSRWVKDDVVRQYGIDPAKIQVIFEAPTTETQAEPSQAVLAGVRSRYQLEAPFALYPAGLWHHKNHIRLLEALASLRDREGLAVRLVCTGALRPDCWPRVERCLHELRLADQVKFVGLVPDVDLRALFSLAEFLIFPTLFEAISLPIFEAWQAGLPVACSNATALPEQVGDAALVFDAKSPGEIAAAIRRMATDPELRATLRRRGGERIKDFSWERTAKAYRAVYRRVGDAPLTEEDRWLLSWDWRQDPKREERMAGAAGRG
jgi:glycosyltransferase involved in cell wall biosynthesis